MNLITKEAVAEITGMSGNVATSGFDAALTVVQDSAIANIIGDNCLADILALDPDLYDSVDDTRPELHSFYYTYVRPYIAWKVYQQLVSIHGLNWTAQGITKFKDGQNTAEAISNTERQSMVNVAENAIGTYLTKLKRRFSDVDKTFDTIVYSVDSEKYTDNERSPGRISGIGNPSRTLRTRM